MVPDSSYVDKHRLAGLQDGVYAIAVTLLVLELKLPHLGEAADSAAVWAALVELRPKIGSWLLSFWVLSVFWSGETRLLRTVRSVDRHLLSACLVQLALASLLPFTTALDGEHGNLMVPAALYSAHVAAMAVVGALRLLYVRRHAELLAEGQSAEALKASSASSLWTALWTLLAFALAFVWPGYNMLALLPLLFTSLFRRLAGRSG